MSEQIKYEAVFGDQSLFDGAADDVILVIKDDGAPLFYRDKEKYPRGNVRVSSHDFKVSMRRIIQEPKRWTVEDQKAGRLPEVGAELLHESEGYVNFVGEFDFRWMLRTKEGGLYLAEKFYCSPIETPEERAKREEDEFVDSNIVGVEFKDNSDLSFYRKGLRAAYRKLKMPEVL